MKKSIILTSVLLILLTGCATTVRLNTLAPSEINLGANQIIAVAPVSFEYWGDNYKYVPVKVGGGIPVPDEIKTIPSYDSYMYAYSFSSRAADMVYSALSEGVYEIVNPRTTKKYLDSVTRFRSVASVLSERGITLLFDSSLDGLDYTEYIDGEAVKNDKGETYYVYYLVQKASLSYSYRLLDLKTNKVVDSKAYFGRYPVLVYEYRSKIAQKTSDEKVTLYTGGRMSSDDIYENIFSVFANAIRDRLVPHVVTLRFSLLTERRNKEFEAINKLVDEGYLSIACDQYMDVYQRTENITAGYNAAVLKYALGNQVEAIDFARELYNKTLNADCGKLLQKMKEAYASEQEALSQITEIP